MHPLQHFDLNFLSENVWSYFAMCKDYFAKILALELTSSPLFIFKRQHNQLYFLQLFDGWG
jgi:hypothetical protein